MDETCTRLREVFRTKNALTFPVSGTGMAGMECVATNLIELWMIWLAASVWLMGYRRVSSGPDAQNNALAGA